MAVTTASGEAFICDAILEKLAADEVTLYMGGVKTTPTKSSAGTAWTAPTGGARVEVTLARTNDTLLNTLTDFGNAAAAEEIVGVNIYDAASSGTRLFYGTLTSPVTTISGQALKMLAGAFSFSPDVDS